MIKHYNISVKGKVQGVFYRATTKEKARELGLKGFVKNMADGSVYLEAQGEPAALEQLVEWCNKGPKKAVVEEVSKEEGPLKNFDGFEVMYF